MPTTRDKKPPPRPEPRRCWRRKYLELIFVVLHAAVVGGTWLSAGGGGGGGCGGGGGSKKDGARMDGDDNTGSREPRGCGSLGFCVWPGLTTPQLVAPRCRFGAAPTPPPGLGNCRYQVQQLKQQVVCVCVFVVSPCVRKWELYLRPAGPCTCCPERMRTRRPPASPRHMQPAGTTTAQQQQGVAPKCRSWRPRPAGGTHQKAVASSTSDGSTHMLAAAPPVS